MVKPFAAMGGANPAEALPFFKAPIPLVDQICDFSPCRKTTGRHKKCARNLAGFLPFLLSAIISAFSLYFSGINYR